MTREAGASARDQPLPWSPAERLALLAFATLVLASLPFLVHPWFDAARDATIYLETARSLAAGEGYRFLGEPFRVRPPGLPFLLAPWIRQPPDFQRLNLLVSLFGAAGAVGLVAFLRERTGMALALLVGGCVWLAPAYQGMCNQVMSDVPGAALVVACLLLERWVRRAGGGWRYALLGVAVGASGYVRTIALLLLPAIAAARMAGGGWGSARGPWQPALRDAGLFAVCVLLVALPWVLRNQALPPGAPEHNRIHSYWVGMWHVDPSDPASPLRTPGDFAARLPLRVTHIAVALGSRLRAEERGNRVVREELGPGDLLFSLTLVLGTLTVALRRREAAELFALLSLGLLLLYFGFSARLLLPFYLIALGASAEALRCAAQRLGWPRAGSTAVGAALALLLLSDLPPRSGWEEIEAEHRELEAFAGSVGELAGPAVRLATVAVAPFQVFLGQPVYNLRPVILRDPRARSVEAFFDRYQIEAVVLSASTDPERQPILQYLPLRYGAPRRAGDALLWWVRGPKSVAP